MSILTCTSFTSATTSVRSIAFTDGKIVLNGSANGTIWNTSTISNLTITGTPMVECIGGGTAVTKTISAGALSEANSVSFSLLETSGTVTYAFTSNNTLRNLIINGTQTLNNVPITIFGNYLYSNANGNTTLANGTSTWTFSSTNAATRTINGGPAIHDFPWTFNGVGGNWQITGSTTIGNTRTTTLANGTLNLNGSNYSTGTFTVGTGTKTLVMNGANLILTGSGTAWNMANTTGTTITKGSGNALISMTANAAKTFAGGNFVYPATLNQAGTGNLSITGNNTFDNLAGSITSAANATIVFPSSGNTAFANFSPTGTSTYKLTLDTLSATRGNIYVSAGVTGNVTGANDLICGNIIFIPFSSNGTNYVRFYLGSNTVFLTGVSGALTQTYDQSTSPKVYVLETGSSWTVPADFNSSNNTIHLIGAGGGGQQGSANGRGGGGGGYTAVSNLALTSGSVISYSVGTGGASNGGNGSNTTFSTYTANGGTGATSTTAGLGGTGSTYSGGNGGGLQGTTATFLGGAGGGGAAGPFGNGASGGNALYTGTQPVGGGGGGGAGGGSNGGVAAQGSFGAGGNNYLGLGGGTPGSTPGTRGGGGAGMTAGASSSTPAGPGGWGSDILGLGAGGGGGGGQSRSVVPSPGAVGGLYGGGGGGGGISGVNTAAGATGSNGVIIIQYVSTGTPPVVTQNRMFMLF